jgi:hypothetical protein
MAGRADSPNHPELQPAGEQVSGFGCVCVRRAVVARRCVGTGPNASATPPGTLVVIARVWSSHCSWERQGGSQRARVRDRTNRDYSDRRGGVGRKTQQGERESRKGFRGVSSARFEVVNLAKQVGEAGGAAGPLSERQREREGHEDPRYREQKGEGWCGDV